MQTQTLSQTRTIRPGFGVGALALSLLNRVAALDARHRARCRAGDLSDEVLRDVGLTRAELARDRRGG